jgi:hypothetical protein
MVPRSYRPFHPYLPPHLELHEFVHMCPGDKEEPESFVDEFGSSLVPTMSTR